MSNFKISVCDTCKREVKEEAGVNRQWLRLSSIPVSGTGKEDNLGEYCSTECLTKSVVKYK